MNDIDSRHLPCLASIHHSARVRIVIIPSPVPGNFLAIRRIVEMQYLQELELKKQHVDKYVKQHITAYSISISDGPVVMTAGVTNTSPLKPAVRGTEFLLKSSLTRTSVIVPPTDITSSSTRREEYNTMKPTLKRWLFDLYIQVERQIAGSTAIKRRQNNV